MTDDSNRFELGAATPPPEPKARATRSAQAEPSSPPPAREPISETEAPAMRVEDVGSLGASLARAMGNSKFQPVILFGTNNSGKTTLLLSLFAGILSEPELRTGLFLANPLITGSTDIGRRLHQDAQHTFEIKTQLFMEGRKPPKTNIDLPFFIPVEFRPSDRPAVNFAFLESNGEWYRPTRDGQTLFPALRKQIEEFIATYQGGIIFLYTLPYTQMEVYASRDEDLDKQELEDASLAVTGVINAYDRIRASHRGDDQHLILITKWDAHTVKSLDRAEDMAEDRQEVEAFALRRYWRATQALDGLQLRREQTRLNAYCAGLLNDTGVIEVPRDGDLRKAINAYPKKLWSYLYTAALKISDQPVVAPFPQPPQRPALFRVIGNLLDKLTG